MIILRQNIQFLFMNLEVLKEYFSFLAHIQIDLQNSRERLEHYRTNSFSFYKLIATKSQPSIDHHLLLNFIKSFTYNFQVKQPNEILNNPNFTLFPPQENSSQEQLLSKGIQLFLNKWSSTGQLNFEQFSIFLKGETQMPEKALDVEFAAKKNFYQLIEDQIQNLLDAQTFRKTVALHYKNMVDLFEVLSLDQKISILQIKNLYLMAGQRKNDQFYEKLMQRFPLPLEFNEFKRWFSVEANQNKYKQQTKIYYSSIKRKKNDYHYDQEQNGKFMTPNGKTTAAAAQMSSTRMTKGDRLNSVKRQTIQVSKFGLDDAHDSQRKDTTILADILNEEERVNQMKRQLLYQQDYDLELIYERKGKQFEEILNSKYGSCNFTSFVRFIVPQDYQHRYYAFIKYNKNSALSEETNDQIENIIDQHIRKESRVRKWWSQVDREIVFRSYCYPGEKDIKNSEMKKYFTERQCKILLDRFDPNKTGSIALDFFK